MRLDISCESSARQRIHMKLQALFSSKNKVKKLNCRLLQFLFCALRVEKYGYTSRESNSTIFIFHFLHSCIFFIFFFSFFFCCPSQTRSTYKESFAPFKCRSSCGRDSLSRETDCLMGKKKIPILVEI